MKIKILILFSVLLIGAVCLQACASPHADTSENSEKAYSDMNSTDSTDSSDSTNSAATTDFADFTGRDEDGNLVWNDAFMQKLVDDFKRKIGSGVGPVYFGMSGKYHVFKPEVGAGYSHQKTIGEYVFYFGSSSELMLYDCENVYYIDEAYDAGLINDEELGALHTMLLSAVTIRDPNENPSGGVSAGQSSDGGDSSAEASK